MKLKTETIDTLKPLYNLASKKHIQHKFINSMLSGLKELNEAIPSLCLKEYWYGWQMPELEVTKDSYAFYPLAFPAVSLTVDLEADFEELIQFAEDIAPDQISQTFYEAWYEKDVLCFVGFTVRAKMDADYKTTLYNLGHIRLSAGYSAPGTETIYCAS
jgi:hypothetical protein